MEAQLKTALALFADVKKNSKTLDELKENERMSYYANGIYGDFIKQHNIVSRYLIVHRQFSKRAFRLYLIRLQKRSYKDRDEWAERQADYVKYLWRDTNPHGDEREAQMQWQYARDSVRKEMRDFEETYERAKKRSEADKAEAFVKYREQLYNLLKSKIENENKQ